MDALDIIGLQAAVASGSEDTFDDQRLMPGVHLRWSFAAELGFPPYGFWLYRRIAKDGERRLPLPDGDWQTGGRDVGKGDQASLPWKPGRYEWHARTPERCQCVVVRGVAAARVDAVTIETCAHLTDNRVVVTGRKRVRVGAGRQFEAVVRGASITAVRVSGARVVEGCECWVVDPPSDVGDAGSRQGGGPAGGRDVGHMPFEVPRDRRKVGWSSPDRNGWQRWTAPFTLPVTRANWPARYAGAPDPSMTAPAALANADVAEAARRLLGAALDPSPAVQRAHLRSLRAYVDELVRDWPSTLLDDVPLSEAEDGVSAPRLGISRVEHLLLTALNPHIARVLGLAWVDQTAEPGTLYDYTIVGVWGMTPSSIEYLYPGAAPAAQLGRGWSRIGGARVIASGGQPPPPPGTTPVPPPPVLLSRLTRSVRDAAGGWHTDPTATYLDGWALARVTTDTPAWDLPDALFAASDVGASAGLVATLELRRGESIVDLQVAGAGTVVASYSAPGEPMVVAASLTFNTRPSGPPVFGFLQDPGPLAWLSLEASDPLRSPITRIDVYAADGNPVIVGAARLHVLTGDVIGMRHATKQAADRVTAPPAPASCTTIFRHRQALVDEGARVLRPSSLYELRWPRATPPIVVGDAGYGALELPEPNVPIGYVAERRDGRRGAWARLGRLVASSAQAPADGAPDGLLRLTDEHLPDPARGWSHHVAAFELFGARGAYCNPSDPIGVDLTPAAPTALTVAQFDNSAAGGGHAGGSGWIGADLVVDATWSGGARAAYPDARTARVVVTPVLGVAPDGQPLDGPKLAQANLDVPEPDVFVTRVTGVALSGPEARVTLASALPTPDRGAYGEPPVGQVPAGFLILAGNRYPDGAQAFHVRIDPATPDKVSVPAGPQSLLASNPGRFIGQSAYYVEPLVARARFADLPLEVAANETAARGRARATASTRHPFAPAEQLRDPNTGATRLLPESPSVSFVGRQWLAPPPPPIPVHPTDHAYYGPADVNGLARRHIAELDPATQPGVHHYDLARAPVEVVAVADVARRRAAKVIGSPALVPPGFPDPAGELKAWEEAAGEWLTAWNLRHGTALTAANALEDVDVRAAFALHFHGGLRDEELRAYADAALNAKIAFAHVAALETGSAPAAVDAFLTDEVDGSGFGRFLYRLTARNAAGSSTPGECTGPFYTRLSAGPAAPAQVTATLAAGGGVDLVWPLAGGSEVAGYLIYSAGAREELNDLRWFGHDPLRPMPENRRERLVWDPTSMPHLVRVDAPNPLDNDSRIAAIVDDPRLVARDFNRWDRQPPHDLVAGADVPPTHRFDASDLAVLALPDGLAVDEVLAVYRLDEYDGGDPLTQRAFNYWRPPPAGICQLTPDGARVEGLRVGVGYAVAVVVVLRSGGAVHALGTLRPTPNVPPVRIANWHDPAGTDGSWYRVVAVDIAANPSAPTPPVMGG